MKIDIGTRIYISNDYGNHLDSNDFIDVESIDEDRGIIKCSDGYELMVEQ